MCKTVCNGEGLRSVVLCARDRPCPYLPAQERSVRGVDDPECQAAGGEEAGKEAE